jgi:hypothetical protein
MSDRARARAAEAAYRARNRAALLAKQQARQQANREWLNRLKGTTCEGCGSTNRDPHELHFHHRDPATKLFGVGDNTTRNRAAILAEIRKCDVLCWSCHPRIHAELRRVG